MSKLILSNPLIRRYRRSLLRPSSLWIYLTIYVAVVFLMLFLNSVAERATIGLGRSSELFRNLYAQFLVMEAIILWVWAAYNSATAVKGEIANRTYDFFRLLPLSAMQKACGILIGRNLLALLFATASLAFVLLFGLLARIPPLLEGQIVFVLLAVALFVNSVVLLSSNTTSRNQAKTSTTIWILAAVFVGPMFLGPVLMVAKAVADAPEAESMYASFYGIHVPILLLIGLIALYFGIWNLLGVIRKLTFEGEPLFSRKAALLFLFSYEIIAMGLLLPHMPDPSGTIYPLWFLMSVVPAALIPLGSMRTFDDYLEHWAPPGPLVMFKQSNLTLHAGLFAIWVAFSVVPAVASKIDAMEFICHVTGILSFCMVLLLLLELYIVYQPVYAKIGLLLGFLVVTYLILPLILSATLADHLAYYSFLGFFFQLFDPPRRMEPGVRVFVILMNVLLCVIPALLIGKRYASIPLLRQSMTGSQQPVAAQRVG
jgi:hypothetical protein